MCLFSRGYSINHNENGDENEKQITYIWHKYDINWTWPRHGHKYTKYKLLLSMMMVMCIKQHLSNIWGWIHEKVNPFMTEAVSVW